MALTLRGNGQITSDNYTIDSDGDATFDTSTLKVDAANNRVGIGTTSPTRALHVDHATDATMVVNAAAGNQATYLLGEGGASKFNMSHKASDDTFQIYNYYNSGISLKIDSSGRVTKPSQVSFKAHGGVAGYITTSPIQFSSVSGYGGHNVGGHFNTSNYRFTCPIAGRYFFHLHMGIVRITTGTGAAYPTLRVNGTNNEYSYVNFQSAPSYATAHISVFKNLAVNDYVDVMFTPGSYGTYYGGFAELAFSGFLVG